MGETLPAAGSADVGVVSGDGKTAIADLSGPTTTARGTRGRRCRPVRVAVVVATVRG